jgi:hypothetical protein
VAVPVLQSQGTITAVTTGNLTVTIPTGEVADDILVVTTVAWVVNTTTGANTIAAPSGWNKFTPAVTTLTGGLIDAEYSFFWKRATSNAETNPTFVRPTGWDTGNDTVWAGRCYVIRGCVTTGDPWTQLVASTVSTAANPSIPAVNVNNTDNFDYIDLPVAFIVKADNTLTPTSQDGIGSTTWNAETEASTTTGTDAGFRAYTISFYSGTSQIGAANMLGGTAPAQGGSVYFVASFKPPQPISRTATGSGAGTETATGIKYRKYTRTASGVGFSDIIDSNIIAVNTQQSGTDWAGQSFKGTGAALQSFVVYAGRNTPTSPTDMYCYIYAHTGTYGVDGKPTGSPIATSVATTLPASISGGYTVFNFSGANKIILDNDIPYFAVWYSASAQNFTKYFTGDTHSGNSVSSTNSGTTWVSNTSDNSFYVIGSSAVGNIPPIGINWSYWGTNALLD